MKTSKKFFALLLTFILAFTCGLIACKDNGDGDNTPSAGYRLVNSYNGKTAEQIYADAIATSSKNNFSYSIDYSITRIISLAAQGTSTHYLWFSQALKKADNDIHYEKTNNLGRFFTGITQYEDKGKFIKKQTLVSGTNYAYSATVFVQGDVHTTHNKNEIKTQISYEQFFENLGVSRSSLLTPLYNFVTEDFKDVKIFVNKLDSSDVFFTLTIKGDKAKTFTKNLLSETLMQSTNPTSNTEVTYMILLTDDGKFEKAQVSFKIQEGTNPYAAVYSFKGDISFSDVGSTTVTAPENADEYVEVN